MKCITKREAMLTVYKQLQKLLIWGKKSSSFTGQPFINEPFITWFY